MRVELRAFLRGDHRLPKRYFLERVSMLIKLLAGSILGLGLLFTGSAPKEKAVDCCAANLACCQANLPCCQGAKAACCQTGQKCCSEGKACCSAAQKTGSKV